MTYNCQLMKKAGNETLKVSYYLTSLRLVVVWLQKHENWRAELRNNKLDNSCGNDYSEHVLY